MKHLNTFFLSILLVVLCVCSILPLSAQSTTNMYTVISGVIVDKSNEDPLIYANISVPNTNLGTVTNTEGRFSLKIPDSVAVKEINISHIGYKNYTFSIQKGNATDLHLSLAPAITALREVIIHAPDVREIVEKAVEKIKDNYSNTNNLLTGFYRETVKKKNHFISVSEAVMGIYKQKHSAAYNNDRTEVYKGRKLLSQKASDTLAVKLLGGPNLVIYADVVKNPDLLISSEAMAEYNFHLKKSTIIDKRYQYVIAFEPRFITPYALYIGELYIDKESLAITRAIFHLDIEDLDKATSMILKKKPKGLRFKPIGVNFIVTYETEADGFTYLRYIRNDVEFKCDWKRHFFATKYAVTSEMVITDRQIAENRIPWRRSFRKYQSLTDKVEDFQDPNFWEDYNILEPTETLDKAVNKLKKKR